MIRRSPLCIRMAGTILRGADLERAEGAHLSGHGLPSGVSSPPVARPGAAPMPERTDQRPLVMSSNAPVGELPMATRHQGFSTTMPQSAATLARIVSANKSSPHDEHSDDESEFGIGASVSTTSSSDEADSASEVDEAAAGPNLRQRVRRLLDRDGASHQSAGNFNVRHTNQSAVLFWGDIFHVVIHLPFLGVILLFVVVYLLSFLLFAVMWYFVSEDCNIGLETFLEALYLSIETQMTIGYGVPDPYFRNCSSAMPVLLGQSLTGLVIDAMMIGIMFQHVSCAYTRAATVIFSNTAVLQVIDGCVHLVFRVAEMQKQPLLQAVMQVYCVQHHNDASMGAVQVEVTAMQLKEPDTDMYNGVLFLGLPTMVMHRIDCNSPLSPPRPVLANGQLPPSISGSLMDYPTPAEVKAHLRERPFLEVLVLLSGTEDATASSIEARHSYTLQDIFWNKAFKTCVSIDPTGFHCINFNHFHTTTRMESDLTSGKSNLSEGLRLPARSTYAPHCMDMTYDRPDAESSTASPVDPSAQKSGIFRGFSRKRTSKSSIGEWVFGK